MHLSSISTPTQPFLKPKSNKPHHHVYTNNHYFRSKKNPRVIRCRGKIDGSGNTENYYELLGVSIDSNPQAIREAYRKLQKKHHPDIAGKKGHEHTLMLNEAYHVLMRENLRKQYDTSIGQIRVESQKDFSGSGYSSWNGPVRPQALFVDEDACVGCRECVHHASKTFVMDDALGCARVKVQFGDDDKKIEVSVDSCPVNCIHWVEQEDLAVLEFLNRPRPKDEYGMFGGGWDRPTNVFMAAKFFIKQQKERELSKSQKNDWETVEEETPAQAEARASANVKLQMEKFTWIWSRVREFWLQSTKRMKSEVD